MAHMPTHKDTMFVMFGRYGTSAMAYVLIIYIAFTFYYTLLVTAAPAYFLFVDVSQFDGTILLSSPK